MGCCDAVFSFKLKYVNKVSRIPLVVIALFSSLLASPALADIAEICNVPKKLTFTSFSHPKVQSEVQPLISRVYKKLGIDVEFVVTASMRDLKLIASGELMGAAIFSEDIIDGMEGIIKIRPALLSTSNMLICRKGLPCSESEVTDFSGDKPLAISRAMSGAFKKYYRDFNNEHLIITNEMKNVLNLIKYNRIDRGIYPISDHTKGGLQELPSSVDSEFLYSVSSYHIISSQLVCLQPMVEQVLADELLAQK